jgi:hypothetical protein
MPVVKWQTGEKKVPEDCLKFLQMTIWERDSKRNWLATLGSSDMESKGWG